jgi:hypothetical protein
MPPGWFLEWLHVVAVMYCFRVTDLSLYKNSVNMEWTKCTKHGVFIRKIIWRYPDSVICSRECDCGILRWVCLPDSLATPCVCPGQMLLMSSTHRQSCVLMSSTGDGALVHLSTSVFKYVTFMIS